MFFKKETPADRIRKEIESTEFKKQSMISTIESEKGALLNEKWKELYNMGVHAYEQHKDENPEYDFSSYVEAIKILDDEISEKDNKIEEIAARYDEEVDLLNKSLQSLMPPEPPAVQMGQAAPVPVQMGQPMQAPPPIGQPMQVPPPIDVALQNQDVSPQAPADAFFCNQCGKGLETGDAFCPFCGSKV